jgi:hypothetical protein
MATKYGMLSKALDEMKLRRLYKEDLLTDAQIAAKVAADLGLETAFSDVAVARLRKRWGIGPITPRQRRERQEGHAGPSLDDVTPAILRDLYSRMGERQIAKHYGVKKSAIQRLRKLWGIEAISKTERSTSVVELTEEQKEVIIGSMLGDGHLLERGIFKVTHAYLKHVHDILSPISRPMFYEEKQMHDSGEVRAGFGFRTDQHVWLKAMRRLLYPNGEKVFLPSIIESLTERSLAFWYFDDGTLEDGGIPAFAVGDFSEEQAQEIAEGLGRRFNLRIYVTTHHPTCKMVKIRAASARRLFEIVAPHITPDMLHKLPERFWPKEVRPLPKIQTSERISLPKELRERCKAWAKGDNQLVDDLLAFWRGAGFPYHVARPEDLSTLARLELGHILQRDTLKARQVGQSSCQAFMPHIWDAHNAGSRVSPKAMFDDDTELRRVLEGVLERGQVPNAAGVRRGLRYRLSGVYNFRPSVAKVLVDRYCPEGGTVFDPCGGWGGRMLGALTSSAKARYIACEPSTKSFQGLHELARWVDRYVPGSEKRVELSCVAAEEFEPPPGVDMVLTSPPYWKQEHYADENTQSSARYGTYEVWLERFWKVVVERAVRTLAPGGWLVLNVDDFIYRGVKYNLVEDTAAIGIELGLGQPERIRYAMPSPVKADNCEWVLVWCRRGALAEEQEFREPVEVVMPLPERPQKEIVKVCEGCTRQFHASRTNNRFCGESCATRARRRAQRRRHPRKDHRVFTCQNESCGQDFKVSLTGGRPKHCPKCRVEMMEADEFRRRTKTCAYRHCGREFVDYSKQNSGKFCHEEHRRREKLLRRGEVGSVQDFRKPDPMLDDQP